MNKRQPPVPPADGFRATLQSLTPADFPFLTPATTTTTVQDTVQRPVLKKRRQRPRSASPDAAISAATSPVVPVQAPDAILPASMETAAAAAPTDPAPAGDPSVPSRPMQDANDARNAAANLIPSRKRRHVERPWPPSGTILRAEYHGVVYTAEIVTAIRGRRLKSGCQVKLLDGPAKGRRLSSFSRAMLTATAGQRRAGKLGRKGVGNGWTFWQEVGPVAAADPAGSASAPVAQAVPVVSPTAQSVAS